VPLTDGYSAQETGPIAFQCPDHPHYHVMSESLIVEVLDDQNQPCQPGETGRVVITTLANFASPLIRYEIGDYAEVGGSCPCGRGLPVLTRILGRTRNLLVLPDGSRIWPRLSLSRLPTVAPVSQVQMVQIDTETLELRVVADTPLAEPDLAALRDYIAGRLDHPFAVRVKQVDAIPRAKSGKFEDFLSLVQ
jgi:phenylacetate-CoA ligase